MSDREDISVVSEVVRGQMEEGIARDLAIKLLARLVSQAVGGWLSGDRPGSLRSSPTMAVLAMPLLAVKAEARSVTASQLSAAGHGGQPILTKIGRPGPSFAAIAMG